MRACEMCIRDSYYQVRAHTLAAQEAFRGLAKVDPDSWYIHRAQAEIDSEGGQSDKAVEEYQAAVNRNPGDADLYEALGDDCLLYTSRCV